MQDNLLTFTFKNWITVFLMFMLGWGVVSFAARAARGKIKGNNSSVALNPAGAFVGQGG